MAPPSKRTSSTSRTTSAYPRKRGVVACQVCRARRTKCDQKKPVCTFCERSGATCVTEESSSSSFDAASLTILDRIEKLSGKIDRLGDWSNTFSCLEERLGTLAPIELLTSGSDEIVLHHLLPENLDAVFRWPVFGEFIAEPPTSARFITPISESHVAQKSALLVEIDPLTCNTWLDQFFDHVHIKNPVLDEAHTRRMVRKVCQDGFSWDAESSLALLICANGALIRDFPSPASPLHADDTIAANTLFQAGRKRLGCAMESSGLVQAQCFFFAGVFLMSVLQPFEAWRMFLQGLAICQSFHLTAGPQHTSLLSNDSAQDSIYWSCWKSEREVRWELGLSDIGSLSLEHVQRFPSLPAAQTGESLKAWYFYLSEISLWRLETQTRTKLASFGSGSSRGNLKALTKLSKSLSRRVVDWQDSLDKSVSIDSQQPACDETDVLRFVLKGRTTYFNELITWPYVYAAIMGSKDCIDEAESLARDGFRYHLSRLIINQAGFHHQHHGTWLMLRSSARSACILAVAALQQSSARLLPKEWLTYVQSTIDALCYWHIYTSEFEPVINVLKRLIGESY